MNRRLFSRHRGPEEWWSKNATIEDWFDEMVGIANIIKKYAAVRLGDIKGRNLMFSSIKYQNHIEKKSFMFIDKTFMRKYKFKLYNLIVTNIAWVFLI